jgi:hypothetical protein
MRVDVRLASVVLICAGLAACGDSNPPARGVIDRGPVNVSTAATPAAATPAASPPAAATAARSAPNRPPTIRGTASNAVLAGASFSFSPTASDPDGDSLTFTVDNPPRWASFDIRNGRLYGTPGPGDVGRYESIRIAASDGTRRASLAAFSVDVVATALGTITISWIPATEREDGSPLTNVGGHRIYWGTKIGDYPNVASIDNPGITTYVIDGLVAATYYLAATTLDGSGVESELSQPVRVTIR